MTEHGVGNDIIFAIGISDSNVQERRRLLVTIPKQICDDDNEKWSSEHMTPGNLLEVVGDISCNELYVGNTTKTNFKVLNQQGT